MEKVVDLLREKGLLKVVKKVGRVVVEGLVVIEMNDDNIVVFMVEVNLEIDFVVKNEDFKVFVKDVVCMVLVIDKEDIVFLLGEIYKEGIIL